jgi:uncharacterized repeat protein (TIGR03803 family)
LQVELLEDRLVLSLTTLASFQYFPNGSTPNCGLVEDSSGNLFGTTSSGGASNDGMVFEVKAGSGAITILASFNGANGVNPQGNLVEDSSGNLFGTTTMGGASSLNGLPGYGTVFELAAGGSAITTLASFNLSNGADPQAGVIEDSNGNLFGTTSGGGALFNGTVFEVKAGSGAITTLASFNFDDAANPQAGLIEDGSGNLFGTTTTSDAMSGVGAVFEVKASSGAVTVLAAFNGSNGTVPSSSLVEDNSGNFFGTTSAGGPSGSGTVFEVAAGSGVITTVAAFDGSNGSNPQNLVVDSSGNLFCTASYGPSGGGAVFEVVAGSGTVTMLAPFNDTDHPGSQAGLIEDSKGNLFGTTGGDIYSGNGTVFELAAGSGAITTLAAFAGFVGQNPSGGMVEDSQGDFFGTAEYGGASDDGAIFELAAGSNTITLFASFNGSNGSSPQGDLVEDGSGNLFGTTAYGGASASGTIFEVAAGSSTITTLASFNGTDGENPSDLSEDSSGDLFGYADGTLFELAAGSHTITTFASFNSAEFPPNGPLMDSSGNFFGTTPGDDGTVFEVADGSSTITTLASFNGSNGADPLGGVIEDSSGNLFGTTYDGGASSDGTLFEVAAGSGAITTLASFNGSNGELPQGRLVEDSNGNLFGTTTLGGAFGNGTLFELAAGSSTISTLVSFNVSNGEFPTDSLLEDNNGNFFGIAPSGGVSGAGTVFELSITGPISSVLPLPTDETTASFTVSWYGIDKPGGSGIASYSIYVSDNGGPFFPYLTNTTQTSTTFTGQSNHSYAFYSIATDLAGITQSTPTSAQATTKMVIDNGIISGTVFRDYNGNGSQDSGEPGLAGQIVYLDLNFDGAFDPGDPSTITDANGAYSFTGLTPAAYDVRQWAAGGVLTSKPSVGSYSLVVMSGSDFSNENFADVLTSIAVPLTLPPFTAFPPQGSANADYVEGVYRAILDRNADSSGLSSWTGDLNSGKLTRLQVVQGIRNSPEHFAQEVNAFYVTLLGRAADSAGVSYWVAQLQNGVREEQIAFDLLDSSEYLSKGDKYFVDSMYQSLLGRSSEASGEAYWLKELGDNSAGNPTQTPVVTHAQVINDFLFSEESLERLVEGYYEVFLERPADPGGLNSWVAELQQALPFLTIGEEFLSSDEFYNRAAANK